MEIKQLILTKNPCYKAGKKMVPTGIVVHSSGANNPCLSRYINPDDGILGANKYNNHWNSTSANKCVHAMIGRDKNGTIRIYQTLPWDYQPWGCGSGSKGSYNQSHIQFEILEDDQKDKDYFTQVYDAAVEFCAYLCKMYNIKTNDIVGHYESHKLGYASNHADPQPWFQKFSKSMNLFRETVTAKMKGSDQNITPVPEALDYSVGTYKVTTATLNVRKGAGTNYSVIKAIPAGTVVKVSQIQNKSWGYVEAIGGWCNISNPYCTSIVQPQPSPLPETEAKGTYTIQKGDSLGKIAKLYQTTIAELAELNGIKNPNLISVGQKLILPGKEKETVTYTVKKGDSLIKIAREYNTTAAKLAESNGIKDPGKITVGQKIVIC